MLNVGSMHVLPEGDKVTCVIHSFTNFILCLFKTTFGKKPYLWCWKLIFRRIHDIVCVCVCVCVLVTHLRPALCSPMDCSSPGSSIHGITQARILEWVATPFSRGSSQPRGQTQVFALGANSLPSEPPGKPTWHSLFLNLKAKSISLICFNRDSLTLIFK